MVRKKKPIEDIDDIPEAELVMKILAIPDHHSKYRSFIAALWLFGNRISEVLGIRTRKKIGERTHTKTTKRGKTLSYIVPVYKTYRPKELAELKLGKYEVEPPKAVNYEVDANRKLIKIHGIHTLKRDGRPKHTYVASIKRKEENELWKLVHEQIASTEQKNPIWDFSRKTGWYYCNHYLGIPPHKLRGMRATRDSKVYNLDATILKKKFNWSSSDMALHYALMNTKDVEDSLERNS